ncbi:uncharacterized protein LOC112556622 isoform X2 [Pomacea canaliculata]|uniref:uncharacterized protein LOC112556622 isoform X2 n=1 Tax=Pomacea canaliculata TaxID=400727 RepID=UPI000D72D168|nr:uncharacterized protein LOC112556622 isoform X2 [Pomacea canaliculata]
MSILAQNKCRTVLFSRHTLWRLTCIGASLLLIYFIHLWFTIGNESKYVDSLSYKKAEYLQNAYMNFKTINQREYKVESQKEDELHLQMSSKVRNEINEEKKRQLHEIGAQVKDIAEIVSHCKGVPGMTIAMVKGEQSVLVSLGKADVVSGRPVTKETKFLMNSLTKTFLGQLLGVLISESSKNISWDTRVKDILGPDFQLVTSEVTQEVTLRDLLSHRSGLSSGNLAVRSTYPQGWTKADLVNQGPLSAVCLLSSNAEDMVKWIKFNLRSGCLEDGRQLIRRDIWMEMWHHQIDLSPMFLKAVDKSSTNWPVRDISEGYGLFWFLNKYRGFKICWHGGGLYSHYTLAWMIPEKEIGLYISINGYSGDSKPFSIVESLVYYTADLLLGYQPWLDQKSICYYPSYWTNSNKQSSKHKMNEEFMTVSKLEVFLSKKHANPVELVTTGVGHKQEHVSVKPVSEDDKRLSSPSEAQSFPRTLSALPVYSYAGVYFNPLFGNLTFFADITCSCLQSKMNMLSGILHPVRNHTFDVELTESLRFLSKPSKQMPPQAAFKVDFTVDSNGEVSGVDVHSGWSMEVPIHFIRRFR